MSGNRLNYRVINAAALMLLLYIGFSNINLWWNIVRKCISVLLPFIIGFVFAYALTPCVRYLERKGFKKLFANLTVIFGIVLLLLGLLAMTLPFLYDQVKLFANMVVEVFDNIGESVPLSIGNFEIKITDYLNDLLKQVGTVTSSTTMDLIGRFIGFFGKFIVGFVGFIYFIVDMDKIRSTVKQLLNKNNKRFFKYVRCMDTEISNYLKGLGIFMIIQFFEYGLIFFLIGHPNWLILGILACLTTVIPYFGGLITNLIAILLASVVSFPLMIATTVVCIIFPQLDGYVISPRVYGKTNNVNPLITIMAVSVGGTLAGAWGIVIALPCYLLIRTTYLFFQNDLKKSVSIVKGSMN